MTLRYYFGGGYSEPFEKDLDLWEIEEYLKTLPTDELVVLVQDGFELLDKSEQHDILTDMKEQNFACPDYEKWLKDDWNFCVELITDDSILERLEDELREYFEDEAMAEYEEQEAGGDPMSDVGMSQRDFF